ncbi:hypothetical protein OAR00_00290 [Alphaproteobacteria bacterium]|nr:hypothetical protein [Alphaproteobacteria bacterium]
MYPFWRIKTANRLELNARSVVQFLDSNGFGLFQTMEGRNNKGELFRNDNGILGIHSPNSVREFLIGIVEDAKNELNNGITQDEREECSDKLVKLNPSTLQNWCALLRKYSESGLEGTTKIKLYRDDEENCYIPFSNGVVHITANDVSLLGTDALKDKGCVWERNILQHDISIVDVKNSPFKDFVHYALKSGVNPVHPDDGDNDYNEGVDDRFNSQKDAFETAFGYLIHSYQPPDESKVIVFIDVDSSPDRTEGGNGKSVSMSMIEHYRKTSFVDGKSFRKQLNDSARFNFSNVEVDTGFVFINDLNPDFDLTQLFSIITDDMTIEGKGTNKFVIPRDKKPKMGITTNYVITGVGGSYERRQHIVEFGNFWNKCNSLKIKPQQIIGKLLGNGFNENDWVDFYNYGFYCIQRYLKDGLIKSEVADYQRKTLVASIEGVNGTGEIVDWIEDYIATDGKKYEEDGQSTEQIYQSFTNAISPHIVQEWDMTRFITALWNYVKFDVKLEWNPHLASKGDTRSKRRWRKGERGNQKEYVRIVNVEKIRTNAQKYLSSRP